MIMVESIRPHDPTPTEEGPQRMLIRKHNPNPLTIGNTRRDW